MDFCSHDTFPGGDGTEFFGEPGPDFALSDGATDNVAHGFQSTPYNYTDNLSHDVPLNQSRDRVGVQNIVRQGDPRSVQRIGLEQRSSKTQATSNPRFQPQQILKDGLRQIRHLQDIENRLTQRIVSLEGRTSTLENSLRHLGTMMKAIKELSESHHGMIDEAIKIAQALNADSNVAQGEGATN